MKNINFVNLHGHSTFSVFDGLGYPGDHIDYAISNGSNALALTDHGNMNGLSYQVLHTKKLLAEGKTFKPIFGVESYFIPSIKEWAELYAKSKEDKKAKKAEVEDEEAGLFIEDEETSKKDSKDAINFRAHLVLLAQNQKGLSNIYQLVSKSYKPGNFYRFPRLDFALLKEHSEGVIALSACMGGALSKCYWAHKDAGDEKVIFEMKKLAESFKNIFGDRFYIEMQWNAYKEQHEINKLLISVAQDLGIQLVSTCDSHYPRPELWKEREIYKMLGWLSSKNTSIENLPKSKEELKCELYPKNGSQMWEAYQKYSQLCGITYDDKLVLESFETTYKIAHEKIESFMPSTEVRLPSFVVPNGTTDVKYLFELAHKGLKALKLDGNKDYLVRLEEELSIIQERGFSKYFLTMKAISDRASKNQLVGAGRGSGAGSLVSYVLGITQIDPIKYGLLFSRFLQKNAKDYPDIDYDVSDPMKIKQILIDEWGDDSVVPISNWVTLQLRSLLKDIGKLYNIPYNEINSVTSIMLKEATGPAKDKLGMVAGAYTPTYEDCMEFSSTLQAFLNKYPEIGAHVKALQGQIRSNSRHAGGILVSENISKNMPLIASRGVTQTPWCEGQNVRHLEPMGFIKFDVLGLNTLSILEQAIARVLKKQGNSNPTFDDVKSFYDKTLHPSTIDLNDQNVYENVFHDGRWVGIFQFDKKGAQEFCKKSKPRNIIDLAAVTSIFRPGPLCLSGDTKILRRKNVDRNGKVSRSWKTIEDIYNDFHSTDIRGIDQKYRYFISSIKEQNLDFVNKNKIINVYKSGKKEVFSITVETNLKETHEIKDLMSSKDHMFLTTAGWKKLEELTDTDYICILQDKFNKKQRIIKKQKNIIGTRNFKNICFKNYKYKCIFCDWKDGSLDVNHISGNRYVNNDVDNLSFMCPNHHRIWTEGNISAEKLKKAQQEQKLPYTNNFRFVRFVSKKSMGERETFDIEMNSPNHNFIAGGCVVHNSSGVDKNYVEAKENPHKIKYINKIVEEITKETSGFLIFQEQIALIAHKLGKDLTLDEGNLLRKVLTKKGTGKGHEVKDAIKVKFMNGSLEKGLTEEEAENLWKTFEFFSGYGFNKSHAVCYSILSYQCAYMLTYHQAEWVSAFLDEQTKPEEKVSGISSVKSLGLKIVSPNINVSGDKWESSSDGKTFYQPLSAIKGLGDKAIEQIINNRPFKTIDELLFNENIVYSKLNKKSFDALIRCGALDPLMDSRFNGRKHFWLSVCNERPKTLKKLNEYIAAFAEESEFTKEETIENSVQLLGFFPIDLIVSPRLKEKLDKSEIRPISEYDPDLKICWFIPTKVETKVSKNNKQFYVVTVVDSLGVETIIRCWAVDPKTDVVYTNRPYVAKIEFDEEFGGFSCMNFSKNWKIVG